MAAYSAQGGHNKCAERDFLSTVRHDYDAINLWNQRYMLICSADGHFGLSR